jgi:hypothetical protein
MINNIEIFLTFENIYLLANWGVLPFWLMLLVAPNHGLTKFFVHSIIAPLLLASAYIFITYKIYLSGEIFEAFSLYLSLENLYALFSDEAFLLIFWLHFLSISLFTGVWIARDSHKYFIPRIVSVLSLVTTYFMGPVGLVVYWFIRIFFAKKIDFND